MRYSKLVISQRCQRSCSLLALSSLRFLSMITMRLVMLCTQLATSRITCTGRDGVACHSWH